MEVLSVWRLSTQPTINQIVNTLARLLTSCERVARKPIVRPRPPPTIQFKSTTWSSTEWPRGFANSRGIGMVQPQRVVSPAISSPKEWRLFRKNYPHNSCSPTISRSRAKIFAAFSRPASSTPAHLAIVNPPSPPKSTTITVLPIIKPFPCRKKKWPHDLHDRIDRIRETRQVQGKGAGGDYGGSEIMKRFYTCRWSLASPPLHTRPWNSINTRIKLYPAERTNVVIISFFMSPFFATSFSISQVVDFKE